MKNIIGLIIVSFILAGCETMVKQSQVVPGMNREAVKMAWGSPKKIESNANSCCKAHGEEAWYYFHASHRIPYQPKYVFFKNDAVEEVYVWKR